LPFLTFLSLVFTIAKEGWNRPESDIPRVPMKVSNAAKLTGPIRKFELPRSLASWLHGWVAVSAVLLLDNHLPSET
jgi:hypothetical protein